jgi:hypothetical protein
VTDRPPPQSTVQAAGRVAEDVVSGLKAQPALLGLVILNLIAIGTAVWFLDRIASRAGDRLDHILAACLPGFDLKGSVPHAQQVPSPGSANGGRSPQP